LLGVLKEEQRESIAVDLLNHAKEGESIVSLPSELRSKIDAEVEEEDMQSKVNHVTKLATDSPAKMLKYYIEWRRSPSEQQLDTLKQDRRRRSVKFWITGTVRKVLLGEKAGDKDADLINPAKNNPNWYMAVCRTLNETKVEGWKDGLRAVLEMDRGNALFNLWQPWITKTELQVWKRRSSSGVDDNSAGEQMETYANENSELNKFMTKPGEKKKVF
jgi:hypothetical protein